MSIFNELKAVANQRYGFEDGPWSKEKDLDQVDLVALEGAAESFLKNNPYHHGAKNMHDTIHRLIEEVRRARNWPTPPKVKLDYRYVRETEV